VNHEQQANVPRRFAAWCPDAVFFVIMRDSMVDRDVEDHAARLSLARIVTTMASGGPGFSGCGNARCIRGGASPRRAPGASDDGSGHGRDGQSRPGQRPPPGREMRLLDPLKPIAKESRGRAGRPSGVGDGQRVQVWR